MNSLLVIETLNTLYMVFVAGFLATILGSILGIVLAETTHKTLYRSLGLVVNIGRSIPFAILMIALIPFTRWVIGTSLGTTASIVPLTIAAIPFMARLVENALKAVPQGVQEAAVLMGASRSQRICKVLLPEALPQLIVAITLLLITLVGYSAMAGLVGGGGLGKVAIQYGYQRFDGTLMFTTLVILVLLVEAIEWLGKKGEKAIRRRRG